MSTFKVLLAVAERALHLYCLKAERENRRGTLTEIDALNKEIDDLEKNVNKRRKSGDHALADRLLEQQAHRTAFRQWLFRSQEGGDLYRDS